MTVHKIAGAPITWGVCEVPGWGLQLSPDRVLRELAGIGLGATELGPDGFLPSDPQAASALLASHGLRLVAGFVPAVLHVPERRVDELHGVKRQAETLAAAGAEVLVLAVTTGEDGYESSGELTLEQWEHLAMGIAEVESIAADHGLRTALHPHYGTVVASAEHVDRILQVSEVGICIDTGHLLVGGADPVRITATAGERVQHVHLKDVDAGLAARVRAGDLGYQAAVAAGMYRVLGEGDVDVTAMVQILEQRGYDGWYVLEQDTVLAPAAEENIDPAADAAASLRFLQDLLTGSSVRIQR